MLLKLEFLRQLITVMDNINSKFFIVCLFIIKFVKSLRFPSNLPISRHFCSLTMLKTMIIKRCCLPQAKTDFEFFQKHSAMSLLIFNACQALFCDVV